MISIAFLVKTLEEVWWR